VSNVFVNGWSVKLLLEYVVEKLVAASPVTVAVVVMVAVVEINDVASKGFRELDDPNNPAMSNQNLIHNYLISSYHTVRYYWIVGITKVSAFLLSIIFKKPVSFLIVWQHWLGIAKPISVF